MTNQTSLDTGMRQNLSKPFTGPDFTGVSVNGIDHNRTPSVRTSDKEVGLQSDVGYIDRDCSLGIRQAGQRSYKRAIHGTMGTLRVDE